MVLDVREPVHYPAASGVTLTVILLSSVSALTGMLAVLPTMDAPAWLVAVIVVVVVAVLGYTVTWALRAGTTLTPEHLHLADTVRSRTVPWRAIGAVHTDLVRVSVLVDGGWLALQPGSDARAQERTVRAWWTAHRGAAWRPPSVVPSPPDGFRILAPDEIEEAERPLDQWWLVPGAVTVFLGAPAALALAVEIGWRGAVVLVGGLFTGLGLVCVLVQLLLARRRRTPVPGMQLAVALGVLVAVGVATTVLADLLPGT